MKFEIDIKDFWLDDDDDIEPALIKHIVSSVTKKITESIQEKVDETITLKVKECIEARLSAVISDQIQKCMDEGTIVRGGMDIKIIDYVKDRFENNHSWGSPNACIDKAAERFGKEFKAQYNTIFAGKIVEKMKEQGFLKDDVVKMLLEKGD